MRVHQNQVNPNVQLDAMYAAQKAAAKREAERTRKKLFELSSELAGAGDLGAYVVKLGAREESEAGGKNQNPAANSQKKGKRSRCGPCGDLDFGLGVGSGMIFGYD
jgi:hypothetical protein